LDELVALLAEWPADDGPYVRWTADLDRDLQTEVSTDDLTGVPLPGLSANGLTREPWWGDRPMRLWIARRLYDYRHLVKVRGHGTEPWIMSGREVGRGPDNEPLVRAGQVIARVTSAVIEEATQAVESLPADWGSLQRQ
jgi:hypothetical protein